MHTAKRDRNPNKSVLLRHASRKTTPSRSMESRRSTLAREKIMAIRSVMGSVSDHCKRSLRKVLEAPIVSCFIVSSGERSSPEVTVTVCSDTAEKREGGLVDTDCGNRERIGDVSPVVVMGNVCFMSPSSPYFRATGGVNGSPEVSSLGGSDGALMIASSLP